MLHMMVDRQWQKALHALLILSRGLFISRLHKPVMAARYHKGPCFIGGFKEFSIDKALVCLYNHNRKYGCDKRVLLGKLLESMHVW